MEHEITGHSRKIYKITKNNGMSLWTKAKEITIEIAIIVFAVSLAAFLERSREHKHEQEAVQAFLAGLKTDLSKDIDEMRADRKAYQESGQAFAYISSVKRGTSLNEDSLKRYRRYLSNAVGLIVNNGRYEGFKSSGRLITIEDEQLQNDILDLYQENIPSLINSTDGYNKRKEYLWQLILEDLKRTTDTTDNLSAILLSDKARNICGTLSNTSEIVQRYDSTINKSKTVIVAIDKLYPRKSE